MALQADQDSRARLLEAAVSAFGQQGFHATTTRDIATAAGMSPAALYVHHRSKEELLFLISHEGHLASLEIIRTAKASSTRPTEQLRAVMHSFTAWHAQKHTLARVVNYELGALDPEHLAQIQELRRTMETEIRDLISAGVERGEFQVPDVRLAAASLLSLGVDVGRWYRDGGRWTPEELGASYADVALRIVGAPPAHR